MKAEDVKGRWDRQTVDHIIELADDMYAHHEPQHLGPAARIELAKQIVIDAKKVVPQLRKMGKTNKQRRVIHDGSAYLAARSIVKYATEKGLEA